MATLQYSSLENSMDRGAWQTVVHGVAKELGMTEALSTARSVQFSLIAQSCPTLYDPIDGSPRGSPIPGILQARTLEWVAISFSNA